MRHSRRLLSLCLLVFLRHATADALYTEQQAYAGKQAYDQHCGECHHLALRGTGRRSSGAGPGFLW